jgi:hypothetical protein
MDRSVGGVTFKVVEPKILPEVAEIMVVWLAMLSAVAKPPEPIVAVA